MNHVERYDIPRCADPTVVSSPGPFEVWSETIEGKPYIVARLWEAGRAAFRHTPDGLWALCNWLPKYTPVIWSGCCENPLHVKQP